MQKHTKKLVAIAIIVAFVSVAVTYAAVMYTITVSNTMNIQGYEMTLWRVDTSEQVTSFAWGDVVQGASKTTDQILGVDEQLTIKNEGDLPIYVAWSDGGLPDGVTLTAQYKVAPGDGWTNWAEGVYLSTAIGAGASMYRVQWTVTVDAGAARGAAPFDITLNGATTSTG